MLNLSRPRPHLVLRHALPVVALVVFGALLVQRLATMDMAAVGQAVVAVQWHEWGLAAVATWFSFQALGRYDAIWHRIMQTGVSNTTACRSGMSAVAIGQFLGFGALTASLVRWRCLPELSLWQATRLTFGVTITFSFCAAGFACVAVWWLAPTSFQLSFLEITASIALLIGAAALARGIFAPRLTMADAASLLFWTGLDLVCAAAALYILLPQIAAVPFVPILAAYVIAVCLGLLSNAPGGVGAFDLTLLALLPLTTPEPLVAGIIAFRLIYYIGPAIIALAFIARPVKAATPVISAPAAWGIAMQSGAIRCVDGQPWLLVQLPLVTAALGPAHGTTTDAPKLALLRKQALLKGSSVALYNCCPRLAKAARKAGWHVRRTAMEAMIRPATWSTSGSRRQTLRRKLRNAERARISVRVAGPDLPLEDMNKIAREWALSHGGEHGFSMARYCPHTLAGQKVFLIKNGSELIGFVTFMTGTDWTLDLIRHRDDSPDGAIQAGIVAAIASAKEEGVKHLSLACAPDPRYTPAFWAKRRAGLIQFKRGFGPIWVPRYHAAPTAAEFWLSGLIIGWAIHRPIMNMPWKLAASLKFIMQKYQLRITRQGIVSRAHL